MNRRDTQSGVTPVFAVAMLIVVLATAGVTALLVNIFERKSEAKQPYTRVVELTEDTTDAAEWGKNWPRQYDSYMRTAIPTATRFGGHGGSEALPSGNAEVPHLPSIQHWRAGSRSEPYDPNADVSRNEMRSYVCGQHPEFELWSQGIHARSGVACADCYRPYVREGAAKVSDHWVRSPLLNVKRACQT